MMNSDASPVSRYSFGYVDGTDESYFVYDVKDEDVVTRFLVDVTGQIKFLTWVAAAGEWVLFWTEPKAQCDVYALCGAFGVCAEDALASCACLRGFRERRPEEWRQGDRTGGCVRNAGLNCESSARSRSQGAAPEKNGKSADRFYTMPDVRLPSDAQGAAAASVRDCELACLGNCSCTAYSYNGSCWLWYGDLVNLQDTTGAGTGDGSISIRLSASEFSTTGTSKKLIIGLAVSGFVAAITVVVLVSPMLAVKLSSRSRAAQGCRVQERSSAPPLAAV
ncbi:hypothetical protein EJB05_18152, partial [Eragrostis curvula]